MTWEQYVRIIARLAELGIQLNALHFTGGEPTLWKYLLAAVEYAKSKRAARCIRVVSNAVDRNAKDYGQADIIQISHYGAVNRQDILRLRSQAGRRVKVQFVVHLPWPQIPNPDALPSVCGCIYMAFFGDRVYPCGMSAAHETEGSVGVQEDFYRLFISGNPSVQDLCKTCLNNRKNRIHHMTGLTAEFGVWDSPVSCILSFKSKAQWLRKIYRFMNAKKMQKL